MSESEKKPISGTVGYAMPPNKVETVFRPSLVAYAREHGICLVQVHLDQPLVEQGPFDCLVHKVYGGEWKAQLQDYTSRYPEVVIIDSPASVERLHNRASMLEVVNHLSIPVQQSDTKACSFGIPKQVVINNATHDAKESMLTAEEHLKFPMIAKPLQVNGTDKSHELAVVFSSDGLKKVEPPVVVQEFVNHGGVLFKVYVAGDHVKCVKRTSLPDFHGAAQTEHREDIVLISQISSTTQDDSASIKEAEMPPSSFVHDLAKGLRDATELHLFNFDVIRDARDCDRYLIVDINYFPGYAKVPEFEAMLTDFFSDVIIRKDEDGAGAGAGAGADAAEVCEIKVGCSSETASLDRIVKKQGNCLTMIFNLITGRFFRLINGTMT